MQLNSAACIPRELRHLNWANEMQMLLKPPRRVARFQIFANFHPFLHLFLCIIFCTVAGQLPHFFALQSCRVTTFLHIDGHAK